MKTRQMLPIPGFFNPANASNFHYESPLVNDSVLLTKTAQDYAKQHDIKSAGSQAKNITLLGIDLQKSFCFPEGTLFVGGRSGDGAIQDNIRFAEFIYRNIDVIKDIKLSMDTHFLFQIFFTTFWVDQNDQHPAPNTMITTDDVRTGKYRPDPRIAHWLVNGNYAWLLRQSLFYVEQLEKENKYQLFLWPPHTLLGTQGHNLAGVIQEAAFFHAMVRGNQTGYEIKGGNHLTENYSILSPEVLLTWDNNPLDQKNTDFIKTLIAADYLIIGGQAASHCVKSTIDDLLAEMQNHNPELVKKVYILRDCMSAVAIPNGKGGFFVDFTDDANNALDRFANAGMHVVNSTDPIETWPDFKL